MRLGSSLRPDCPPLSPRARLRAQIDTRLTVTSRPCACARSASSGSQSMLTVRNRLVPAQRSPNACCGTALNRCPCSPFQQVQHAENKPRMLLSAVKLHPDVLPSLRLAACRHSDERAQAFSRRAPGRASVNVPRSLWCANVRVCERRLACEREMSCVSSV